MTYGGYGQQPGGQSGPYPQYPAVPPGYPGAPGTAPVPPPPPGLGTPPTYGGPIGPYPPVAAPETPLLDYPDAPEPEHNSTATLSVVFAFLCAPVGAILGHRALRQIRQRGGEGHDRALIGVTLSYVFIALTVVGLVAWSVLPSTASGPTTARTYDTPTLAGPGTSTPNSPQQPSAVNPSGILLSLAEVRTIMGLPDLTDAKSSTGGSESTGGQTRADPEECVGAIAAGIDTIYRVDGFDTGRRASFTDKSTGTMVDEFAGVFTSDAQAAAFVADSRSQWQKCAGKTFTLSGGGDSLTWLIGATTGAGGRIAARNTLVAGPGLPQLRVLAAQGRVVVDVSVISLKATDQAATMADAMLARVPS